MSERTGQQPLPGDERYRLIFENAPLGLIQCDRKGNIVECNPQFLEIVGASREEVIGFNMLDSPADESMRAALLDSLSGKTGRYDGEYLSVTGKRKARIKARYQGIKSEDGRWCGAVGAFEELADRRLPRRRAEGAVPKFAGALSMAASALRGCRVEAPAADDLLQTALAQCANEGLSIFRKIDEPPFLKFTAWNDRMVEITGYTIDEINGGGWCRSLFPDEESRSLAMDRMARAAEGENMAGEEWEITRPDREKRILRISTSVLPAGGGKSQVLALMYDVTGQKSPRAELTRFRQHLEILVSQQTAELRKTNQLLQLEMSERKRANQALAKANQKLQDIIDFLPDATFVIDQAKKVIAWNRAIEEMTGVKKEEIHGQGDHVYAIPFYGKRRPLLIDMVMDPAIENQGWYINVERSESVIQAETCVPEFNSRQGAYLWGTASLLFDKEKKVIGAIQSIRDISDRKKAEHELRLSEERFRAIFESAQECIYLKDRSFRYVLVNPAMARQFRVPPSELVGKTAVELFGEKAGKRATEYDTRVFAGEIIDREHTRPVRGRDRTFHIIKVPIRDQTGEIIGMCGIARDITERKQMERKLHEALNFLQTLMETIPAPIFYKNTAGRYLGCNRAFEDYLGIGREGIIGKTVYEVAPAEVAEIYASTDTALLEATGVQFYEAPVPYADGSRRDVIFSKSTFKDASGALAGIVGVMTDISERKRAEERFQRMVELSPFPISIIDPTGRYLYLNEKFTQLFGYTLEDIPNGKEWFRKAFPDGQRRNLALSYWISDLEGSGLREEPRYFSVQCKDGTTREVLFRPATIGGGVHFITYEDLTELKRAQRTLLKSEERYRMLFDHSPLGIVHFDQNGIIVDCNRRVVEIVGSSREALIGFNMHKSVADEQMLAAINSALHTGIGYYEGDYLSVTGGKTTPVRAHFGTILSECGEFLGGLCIMEDVSDRKRAEEDLRESERKFRLMAESIQDVFWMGTPDLEKIFYINPAFEKVWGRTRHALYSTPRLFIESAHPEERDRLLCGLKKLAEAEEFDAEYRIVQPDGSVRWVRNRAFPIRNGQGRPTLATGVARDVTDRKLAEDALRQSERELRFLSSRLLGAQEEERKRVAGELHDSLGSSLTAIKISLENARWRMAGNESNPSILENSISLTRLAIEEVRRIIMDLRPSMLDDLGLIPAVEWFCRQFKSVYSHIRISRTLKVEEKKVPDELKTVIFRVVQEALHNVAKHSKANFVRISLTSGKHGLRLAIVDKGEGFDVGAAFSTDSYGKGLGLTSMKERTEFSGGFFSIDSEVGKGTAIRAHWPIGK